MPAETPENLGKPENPEKKEKFIIKIICAWCTKQMGEKESAVNMDSHGICEECRAKEFPKPPKVE